ncbi:hypothetical protein NQ318_001778 [Aromia moschata]|uniref:Mos1 transposase HTH domain-containing protein n=1 Tax=Aromia moschata TaxID=1265417 RepID=A0AAV8XHE7_9CUCU|nr:hypothetical protein NQ318_001778 [Aromia moschata]
MQRSFEQRMAIKFCVKLEKSAAETIPMLKKAFGVDCLSDRQIFRWHKAFAEGREEGREDVTSGTTRTALDGYQPPVPTTIHYENHCSRNCVGVSRNEEGVREARAKRRNNPSKGDKLTNVSILVVV